MWQKKLVAFAKRFDHPAWGVSHSERIYEMSLHLAENQNAEVDKDALLAAAYLHDMGAFAPYKKEGIDHAQRSAQVFADILRSARFPSHKLGLVEEIIKGHMFYADPPSAVEALIFHDADTLDFMGAIGITRILSIIGTDDWTPDLSSALALIRRFTRDLPQNLHTVEAKKIGSVRQQEMMMYLTALASETKDFCLL